MDLSQAILQAGQNIATVAGGYLSAAGERKNMYSAHQYNMEMAKWQNETNIENWKMQNEYNSPLAQMQRLQEAGLNPNLVYGNGVTGNSSGAPASASTHPYQGGNPNAHIAASMSVMLDNALKAAQVDKVLQETSNLAESQRLTQFDQHYRQLQSIGQGYANSKTQAEAEIWADFWDMKRMEMFSGAQLNDARRFDLDSQRKFRDGPQTKLTASQISRNISEMSLNEYRKQSLSAQAYESMTRAGVNIETQKQIVQSVENMKIDGQIKGEVLFGKALENEINFLLRKHGVLQKNPGLASALMNLYVNVSEKMDNFGHSQGFSHGGSGGQW